MPRKQIRPSIKLRKRYAALINICREKVLTSPPQTSGTKTGDALISVCVKWPSIKKPHGYYPDIPEDFPTGMYVERCEAYVIVRHNCVALLKWFKAKNFTTYDAADLFAQRLPIMMILAKQELRLDRMLECVNFETQFEKELADSGDSEYNDGIE
jgi:hypothetical protein